MTDVGSKYGCKGSCKVEAVRPLVLNTSSYDVDTPDHLIAVADVKYNASNSSGPNGVHLGKGDLLKWINTGHCHDKKEKDDPYVRDGSGDDTFWVSGTVIGHGLINAFLYAVVASGGYALLAHVFHKCRDRRRMLRMQSGRPGITQGTD